MNPRQARRERRESERKAKKLELKKSRLSDTQPPPATEADPEIQPRWNPELEDEFPREIQIRNNLIMDRRDLAAGRPIPPPGPTAGPSSSASIDETRRHYLAKTKTPAAPKPQPSESNQAGFVSQNPSCRAETNRANAKLSTGPRTIAGRLASSRNATKHGLASGQVIIPGEDPAAFEAFLNDLFEEHRPASPTEELLLNEMAQSHWLAQRAIRLQNTCFTEEGVNEKQLALFLRYQTTHQRTFHKALTALLKLKKIGFVSQCDTQREPDHQSARQNASSHGSSNRFVSHAAPAFTQSNEFALPGAAKQAYPAQSS